MGTHAEITEVWPRDGRIRVVGHIVGDPVDTGPVPWRLLLTLREHEEHQLSYDSPLGEGRRFDVAVPIGDLVWEGMSDSVKWDLHLATETGARLRVGRRLDGIHGKKEIMVFPAQQVTSGGVDISVKPFYTVKDNLSVKCRPLALEAQGHAA
ncbi:MAG: hypothetical protein M0026_02470 [Nocardiopsaceae bacterium]|nr:hypothetical protein [Nocardiopsaceae bacterium]